MARRWREIRSIREISDPGCGGDWAGQGAVTARSTGEGSLVTRTGAPRSWGVVRRGRISQAIDSGIPLSSGPGSRTDVVCCGSPCRPGPQSTARLDGNPEYAPARLAPARRGQNASHSSSASSSASVHAFSRTSRAQACPHGASPAARPGQQIRRSRRSRSTASRSSHTVPVTGASKHPARHVS